MRPRLYLALAVVLLVSGLAYKISTAQTGSQTVYLGETALFPPSLTMSGTSQLKVTVATGASVPHSGPDGTPIKAVVDLSEVGNLSGISYSVDPTSRIVVVPLTGGGVSNIGTFTISVNTDNTRTGNILLRATLVTLENNQTGITLGSPTTKDVTLSVAAPPPSPTPTPTPAACSNSTYYTRDPVTGLCVCRNGSSPADCDPDQLWYPSTCECKAKGGSPVLVDVNGDGFSLTDAAGGVNFDLDADGVIRERLSWTAPNSDDAFLFLDRNEDGVVNNGTELFGDYTPQPYSPVPNGFVALGMYDEPRWGGNGDGVIDGFDTVYYSLRLWQDKNHNGVSEPNELHTLPEMRIVSISLDYREAGRRDRYGNVFRYRAKLNGEGSGDAGRWAYDVFLLGGR